MWESAYVDVYQLLNWEVHGETLKLKMDGNNFAFFIYVFVAVGNFLSHHICNSPCSFSMLHNCSVLLFF